MNIATTVICMKAHVVGMHKLVHITNLRPNLYEWVEVWATGQSPITPPCSRATDELCCNVHSCVLQFI